MLFIAQNRHHTHFKADSASFEMSTHTLHSCTDINRSRPAIKLRFKMKFPRRFVIHFQEIIPTGRFYIRLLVFLIPGIKIKKYSPFSFPNFNISTHSLKFKFIKGLNFLNTFSNNKKQLHSSCRGCHFMYILNFHLLNEFDHY